jgi:L-threonylcarbamoyladenylate synthase
MERVASLKGIGGDRSFIVLVANRDMLTALAPTLNSDAERLASAFWPGPLTLILPWRDATIAVRWTSHAPLQRIIEAFGAPITSTSANRTGLSPARTAAEIVRNWEPQVRAGELLVLDGGFLPAAAPSTIVDCVPDPPRLVRPGAIDAQRIRGIVRTLAGVN